MQLMARTVLLASSAGFWVGAVGKLVKEKLDKVQLEKEQTGTSTQMTFGVSTGTGRNKQTFQATGDQQAAWPGQWLDAAFQSLWLHVQALEAWKKEFDERTKHLTGRVDEDQRVQREAKEAAERRPMPAAGEDLVEHRWVVHAVLTDFFMKYMVHNYGTNWRNADDWKTAENVERRRRQWLKEGAPSVEHNGAPLASAFYTHQNGVRTPDYSVTQDDRDFGARVLSEAYLEALPAGQGWSSRALQACAEALARGDGKPGCKIAVQAALRALPAGSFLQRGPSRGPFLQA
ncbi:unnamed protein product [Amoebophrya sp. A120]|nr:unnamed protein product [Amoebophrya sp. A120]|eukprot:GSA120T00005951001.1